jgi:DNA-binding CsgD family transcriptional regulator
MLRVGDDEFVLFSWDLAPASRDALRTLTDAEREVLALVTRGASNDEIARARQVSIRTIANQVASLLRKLDASSRFELIRRFAEQ